MSKATQSLAEDATVGRVHVAEYMGYSVKTLDREVSRGNFPRPTRTSPGRVGWPLSVVIAERARRDRHALDRLQQTAVTDPAKLPPDELEGKARELAAAALSKRTGRPVDPAVLSLHLTQQLSAEEFDELEREEHRWCVAALAQLPTLDAAVVAAALLPTLTPVLAQGLPELKTTLDDPEVLKVPFQQATAFLRLFELSIRLSDEGMRVPANMSVLEHLAGFDAGRAMLVAARLFPSLRAIVAPESEVDRQIFSDDDLLEAFAMAALDDARWPEAEAKLQARQEARENTARH